MPKREHAIAVVLGMHRSGTSALTRVLALCGFGLPRTLIPDASDNERGFWESRPLKAFNESLLEELGSSWHGLQLIGPESRTKAFWAARRKEASTLLKAEFAPGENIVVKDPRLCRLLFLWSAVFEKEASKTAYICIVRHPNEVARSLAHRNGLDLAHGLYLWARYSLDAEFHSRGLRRSFVAYAKLLSNWQDVIRRLSSGLSLNLDPEIARKDISEFLSPKLRHQKAREQEHIPVGIAANTYGILSRWAAGSEESEADHAALDALRARLDDFGKDTSGLVDEGRNRWERLEAVKGRADGLRKDIDSIAAQLARGTRTITAPDLWTISERLRRISAVAGTGTIDGSEFDSAASSSEKTDSPDVSDFKLESGTASTKHIETDDGERSSMEVKESPAIVRTSQDVPVGKTMFYGLPALRRDNPWMEQPEESFDQFRLSLDGGGTAGRELIIDVMRERRVKLMVEVGCFLCGSTRTWLEAIDDLTVIGVDPWDGNWSPYVHQMIETPALWPNIANLGDKAADVANILYEQGNYRAALNNIREFKDRFIPVRRCAPEAFEYLRRYGIFPQLIYIDADKHRESLDEAYRCFPRAILTGDDWLWPDEDGVMRMQENVKEFAAEHGFEIRQKRQTWLLIKPTS